MTQRPSLFADRLGVFSGGHLPSELQSPMRFVGRYGVHLEPAVDPLSNSVILLYQKNSGIKVVDSRHRCLARSSF